METIPKLEESFSSKEQKLQMIKILAIIFKNEPIIAKIV